MTIVAEDFFMRPFQELGTPRDERKRSIRGSDPEFHYENGLWHLFHTWGPTHPTKPYSPGIYVNRSRDLLTDYSKSVPILTPNHKETEDDGYETFSCCWVAPLGKWLAMFTKSGPGKTRARIVPAWADTLMGPWAVDDSRAVYRQADWQSQRIGESGICWSESFNAVCMTYGGKSLPPETRWSTGFMASPDYTDHWNRDTVPFALPPAVFQDGSGINAMSHSTCEEDPHTDLVLHCITTHSGNVDLKQKGLIQWVFLEGKWHRRPGFLIQPADLGFTHIGGPSLLYDSEAKRWMMAIHADNKKTGVKRQTRLLIEKETW